MRNRDTAWVRVSALRRGWPYLEFGHGGSMDLDLERAIKLVEAGHIIGAALFSNAAEVADGATTRWFDRRSGVITQGDRQFIVDASVWLESALGAQIVDNKVLTKRFLEQHGIPHPRGASVSSQREAMKLAQRIGGAVVIKPTSGSQGRGVTVKVRGDNAIRSAYMAAQRVGRGVMVEEYIEIDEEYRLIATATECIAVVKRVLPFVTGDGQRSIRALVNQKNDQRRLNPALRNLLIPIDAVMERTLTEQNLTLDDVLHVGDEITVRDIGGLSGGGEPHECSHIVSDEIKNIAVRTVAAIPGLHWAGVDLVTEKGTNFPYVVEVNINAGYGAATFPILGRPNDVAMRGWKLRVATSTHDSTGLGPPLTRRPTAQPLSQVAHRAWGDHDEKPFAELFFELLKQAGYTIDSSLSSIILVTDSAGASQWFSRDGSSGQDLLSTRRVTRRHRMVRRYLALADIPRTRGRLMKSPEQLAAFFRKRPRTVAAIPKDGPWATPRTTRGDLTQIEQLLVGADSSWFVQTHPTGSRARIFVARGRALAAAASEEDIGAICDEDLAEGSRAAVAAVAAIPDLRWAFVDVVLMSQSGSGAGHGERRRALVEGLSTNPPISQRSWLIAGDPADIRQTLLGH